MPARGHQRGMAVPQPGAKTQTVSFGTRRPSSCRLVFSLKVGVEARIGAAQSVSEV
jgi:hypothetical protein